MAPDRAKVFVAEDWGEMRKDIKSVLGSSGHEVVLEASTLSQALNCVNRLTRLGINVAIIDGNLEPRERDGLSGRTVAKAIADANPSIIRIGFAGEPVEGTHKYVDKSDLIDLGRVVTQRGGIYTHRGCDSLTPKVN